MNWKEKYRAFREWQLTAYKVAPLSEAEHDCPTCGTHYQGNYCPRCGQSSRVGRISFKAALLNFVDIWGVGNRSMFRTLRDLLLRPGYMIRDYLNGMHNAYFPPFKMLFLLTTLSVVVAHGFNITGQSVIDRQKQTIISMQNGSSNDVQMAQNINEYAEKVFQLQERFPNLLTLMVLVLMSAFLYIFFRKAKNIPSLRFSEFLIAMIYSSNMTSIYEIIMTFFNVDTEIIGIASLLVVIPLKQFSGFSWIRTIMNIVLAFAVMALTIIVLVVAGVLVLLALGVLPPVE